MTAPAVLAYGDAAATSDRVAGPAGTARLPGQGDTSRLPGAP
jgi:hypothetical protein